MSPFRARIRAVLDPLSENPAAPGQSDFDLNPGARPEEPRELRPAAVLVPVVEHEGGATFLLTRRSDSLRKHTGQIAFPGGRCDPGETPALAADKRKTYLRRYSRPGHEAGWHFLTGREASIKALTDAVGFRYAYDAEIDQYAHPASMTVLTADGRVSKYLYGIEFAPRDLRLALVEASEGRIGTAVDQALLFCYHYDPETGKYGLVILNFVRAAGALTVLLMAGWIVLSLRRERRQANAVSNTATTGTR